MLITQSVNKQNDTFLKGKALNSLTSCFFILYFPRSSIHPEGRIETVQSISSSIKKPRIWSIWLLTTSSFNWNEICFSERTGCSAEGTPRLNTETSVFNVHLEKAWRHRPFEIEQHSHQRAVREAHPVTQCRWVRKKIYQRQNGGKDSLNHFGCGRSVARFGFYKQIHFLLLKV